VLEMKKKIIIFGILGITILLFWIFDIFSYVSLDRIDEMVVFIDGLGIWAPIVFIIFYALATVLFIPGLPLTLLSGMVFGPIYGSIWVSIASTLGASLAFLTGRYIGKDYVVKKFKNSDIFIKLDKGINNHGWKMIAITRLVPIFPFNAQNYVYGLTNVPFKTYALISWICMLPATIGYVFLAGAIIGGKGDNVKTITFATTGIAVLILLSIISKVIIKKLKDTKDISAD
jgi:uncharacterized membrane protein YdjX (TVP38/TMEM64 family)